MHHMHHASERRSEPFIGNPPSPTIERVRRTGSLTLPPPTPESQEVPRLPSVSVLLEQADREGVSVVQLVSASSEQLNMGRPSGPLDYAEPGAVQLPAGRRLWYKEAVFYEIYVRAFCDTSGSGNGDLVGLTSKLDYLRELGVDCIWLLPIYPSPLKDDGYDVADYSNIHSDYGTLENFKTLVAATHERNMRIIIDFVPNHSSDQHAWFQASRSSRDNPYRNWYVWSDDPNKYKDARIIFLDVEKSNWTWDPVAGQYYWHRFYSSQPDLNYDNPEVQDAMLNIMRFWLEMGVDGFRVDAVPFLFEREGSTCESLPETHQFLKRMRAFVEGINPEAVLLCEACQPPETVREYFGDGDEFHMGFHFPLMPRIFLALRQHSYQVLKDIMAQTPPIPDTCQWVTFLRNHDELTLEMVSPEERQYMWREYAPEPRMKLNLGIRRRLAPLFNNDRRLIEAAHSILFTMPGSPIIYYGDEIGMGDNIWLPDRNGVRTPMQWEAESPSAGFSPAARLYAPLVSDPTYCKERVNVKDAIKDPSSLFHVLKIMIHSRRKHSAFGFGSFHWIDSGNMAVAVWLRDAGFDKVIVLTNLDEKPQSAQFELPREAVHRSTPNPPYLVDILTSTRVPLQDRVLKITMDPYQFLWLIPLYSYPRGEDYMSV